MRLGTRLTLAFLSVALIPAGVILTLTWFTVEARFQEEFNERLEGVASGLRSDLDRLGKRIDSKVRALADSEEVERILVDMVRGSLDRREHIGTAAKWMRVWELDMLSLLDGQGKVLSCGHLPARFGGLDEETLDLVRNPSKYPRLREIQISRDGQISTNLAVVVGVGRKFNEAEVMLVGGRLLDDSFVAHLEDLSGAQVVIVDSADRIIATSDSGVPTNEHSQFQERNGFQYRRISFVHQDDEVGELAATVVAGVSLTKLRQAQRRILVGSALAALVGVVISWLLGLLLSRRTTRPVEALVGSARRVATGDLSQRVAGNYSAEMGELVRSFNSMMGDLQSSQRRLVRAERVAAWREIARRIAHEIKNPLSPIQVSIETLRKAYNSKHEEFPEIFEESTRAILEEVAALKRIVTEFSDFARLPKPMPVAQSLNPVLEGAVNLFGAGLDDVNIVFNPDPELPSVHFDRELMVQVVNNLMTNALQALGQQGQIEVVSGTNDSQVFFSVADSGPGMTPETLEKVFTPYFTTRQDGTGLGLAIVQRIVEDHDGAVEIETDSGSGTKVIVSLPFAVHLDE